VWHATKNPIRIASAALALTTTLLALGIGEIAFRALDGYQIASWRLVHLGPVSPPTDAAARHLKSIPLAEGMRAEWFDQSPTPLPRGEVPHALLEATERYRHSIGA
jgi:hypothetical protein